MMNIEELRRVYAYCPNTGGFCRVRNGKLVSTGWLDARGYVVLAGIKGRNVKAHRLAWALTTGSWPIGEIDHVNGIRNDNRIVNLRVVDRQTNTQNIRRAHSRNKIGLLGVSEQSGRFKARIAVAGKHTHLGTFDTAEAAHAAYVAAKSVLHKGSTLTEGVFDEEWSR